MVSTSRLRTRSYYATSSMSCAWKESSGSIARSTSSGRASTPLDTRGLRRETGLPLVTTLWSRGAMTTAPRPHMVTGYAL